MSNSPISNPNKEEYTIVRGILVALAIVIILITSFSGFYFVNAFFSDSSSCPIGCSPAIQGQYYRPVSFSPCWFICDINN